MACQGRPRGQIAGQVLMIVSTVALVGAAPAGLSRLDLMRSDALLADVCFVGPRLGWAVGDRGVIWHTANGGQSWQLQDSHVRCRLRSVYFVDERNGWAAGGWTQAFTRVSQGVLLRTRDGGRQWTPERQLLLPTIERNRFFDTKRGVAFGRRSALFPSGVFTTDDGGQSWAAAPAQQGGSWQAGDFIDPHTGALAGPSSISAVVRRRSVVTALAPQFGLRALRDMQLIGPNQGWAVGDGGLVVTSGDLGRTWQTTPAPLLAESADGFDLAAVAVHDDQCWVAGSPGTRVFHTADGGRNWTAYPTGSRVPIEALTFVDARHGWAVGALGTILATTDGGRTWQRQQSGGARAALVGFFSEPARVPLELFAQLSAGEGYLSMVDLVGRRDLDLQSNIEPDLAERAHEALVEVGACEARTAWQFPLRQDGLGLSLEQLVDTLDRTNDGRALERLEVHLVRQIRTWRPEVVFTHDASPQGGDPVGHLVNQMVLRAVEHAADPTRHVAMASAAGLEPWQVKKVFGARPEGQSGSIGLSTARLEPRLGQCVADYAAEARSLLLPQTTIPPVEIGFQLLVDRIPQDRGRRDFMSGIVLSPGGDARRMLSEPPTETLAYLRRITEKRRNMQALIRQAEENPAASAAWQGQVTDLTRGLDATSACQILHQLAAQYYRNGKWEMAAGTLEALAERHPNHPLARAAQVWLVQYYASGEAAWRDRRQSGVTVQQANFVEPRADQNGRPAETSPVALGTSHGLVGSSARARDERLAQACAIGKQLERIDPVLYAEPRLRFPLTVAQRGLGNRGDADRYLLSLRHTQDQDAWWSAAQGERWLAEPTPALPKSVWTVRFTSSKPHLDGRLVDACWQQAKPVELKSTLKDDAAWPAVAMLAYDRQFLYLAISCRKAPGADYPAARGVRSRDPDLSDHDRIDLLLDIDRDYTTYYRFSIDHRGHVAESCWEDASWDPTWYVAADGQDDSWTVEAAIPLSELAERLPQAQFVWTVGIQRTVPGVGFQSWTVPAGTGIVPEGFGFLMFQ